MLHLWAHTRPRCNRLESPSSAIRYTRRFRMLSLETHNRQNRFAQTMAGDVSRQFSDDKKLRGMRQGGGATPIWYNGGINPRRTA